MPVIKSAIKKLRKDKKREKLNNQFKKELDKAVKKAKKEKKSEAVKSAISLLDKAVKKNLFHANKVARIKSRLSKLVKTEVKVQKKTSPTKKVTSSKAKKHKIKTSK